MRTTLDIDDDVLQAARERARREKRTVGQVISQLARDALTVHGIRPFPRRGRAAVTNELVDKLREGDAY